MKYLVISVLSTLALLFISITSVSIAEETTKCPPNTDPVKCGICATYPNGVCPETDPQTDINQLVTDIINIFSWIVGVVSVLMIIWGGFRYITSGGDSGKVGSAKNTIIYALIGLVVVALAQVIVIFVLDKVT